MRHIDDTTIGGWLAALCTLIWASLAPAQVPKIFVYRNDSTFNEARPTLGDRLVHHVTPDGTAELVIEQSGGNVRIRPDRVDSCVIRTRDVPTLRFTFPGHPEAATVWDKTEYIEAVLDIEGNSTVADATGLTLSVKGRGNSTWNMPKKPIRLKFPSKTSICGFKKAKSHVLLANYIDPSHLRNATALWLARRLGMPYSNHTMPCNVVVNGNDQGLYLLTEKVGINAGSVDIEEKEGMLFELGVEYDEPYRFRSDPLNLPVMVKDPDLDALFADDPDGPTPEERLAEWRKDFNDALAQAVAGHGFEYFDMDSFVDFFLVCNLAENGEVGWPKSVYLHKDSLGDGCRYVFGPIWDFDMSFNHQRLTDGALEESDPEGNLWMNALMWELAETEGFKEAYAERFLTFKEEILPEMMEFIDSCAHEIEPAAMLDGLVWQEDRDGGWYFRHSSFDAREEVAALKDWIMRRVEHMKGRLDSENGF